MLKTRIIPCLDVKDGRVVKGINFLDLIDAGDPVEQAKIYSEAGADEICFLDISASIEKRNTMINVVEKTAQEVFIPLTVGGGISSLENIRSLLKAGADVNAVHSSPIKGYTPLMLAAELDEVDLFEIMLVHGGDIKKTYIDPNSDRAVSILEIASHFDSRDIQLLMSRLASTLNRKGKS